VDWTQAMTVGKSLLISPLVGFTCAGLLLLLMRVVIPDKRLYEAPKGTEPPPGWIRGLLVLTCTGVGFAHGSNDGPKGLRVLILIGLPQTAYALNHAVPASQTPPFVAASRGAVGALDHYTVVGTNIGNPHDEIAEFIRTREYTPSTTLALRQIINDIANELSI